MTVDEALTNIDSALLEGVFSPSAIAAGFDNNSIEETQIGVVGTPVRIGNGNAVHPLLIPGPIERFTLTGAEAQLQQLEYTGLTTRQFHIYMSAELEQFSENDPTLASLSMLLNGSTTILGSVTTILIEKKTTSSIVSQSHVELSTGDFFWPMVSNETDTDDLIVRSCKVSVALL